MANCQKAFGLTPLLLCSFTSLQLYSLTPLLPYSLTSLLHYSSIPQDKLRYRYEQIHHNQRAKPQQCFGVRRLRARFASGHCVVLATQHHTTNAIRCGQTVDVWFAHCQIRLPHL